MDDTHLFTLRSRYAGRLGTVVEVSVTASSVDTSETAQAIVLAEVERLQRVFDAFDAGSVLRRWLAGVAPPSVELMEVVALAEIWRRRSGGAFDPAAEAFVRAWGRAASRGWPPTADELQSVADEIGRAARPRGPVWAPPPVPYSLNAIAKGWIVDRALDAAWRGGGLTDILVNAGGDLAHRGVAPVLVGVEDPAQPYDNALPLVTVGLGDAAIATSGGARRGWTIDGVRYSHVLDPRTGLPVDHHASVSVLAPDAATADVVATAIGVLSTDVALALVDQLAGVGCCIVAADGTITRSTGWLAAELSAGS